ncbi:Tetratricopeptide repeat (TPR)-like superfamily protein [Gossypium australe]|uniref:Tetratricopeptide repeat (TPR)-like superfamily protein n=1 Tax=Gossypium australe TaxID=47621 RepID=A0A5B6W1R3_9ROSI|nr:Tetratricopeptide repeat (TPR)-like superfamily protein [Gossypium australe]
MMTCEVEHLNCIFKFSGICHCYAIEILKYILKIREEKPGMENPNVDDKKISLAAIRNRKGKSLENLLNANSYRTKMKSTKKWSMFDIRS